jgi:hypothetical protein
MRDTWHFVARSDARWLLRLTGPRIQARNATQYRKLGLDPAQLAKTDALLAGVLSGGVQLSRRSLAGELAQRGLVADGPRLGYILMHAELEEVICSGARQGKQQTYALFDDRVPPAASFDRDRALAEAVAGLHLGRSSCRSTTSTSSPTGRVATCSTSTTWPAGCPAARRCCSTPSSSTARSSATGAAASRRRR